MNIKEELKKVHNKTTTLKDVRKILEEEKSELEKKLYLLNVLDLIECIKEFSKTNFSINNNINKLTISFLEKEYKMYITLNWKDGQDLRVYASEHDLLYKIHCLTEKITRVSNMHVGEKVKDNHSGLKEVFLEINENLENNILELFLSKDLRSLLNYTILDSKLNNSSHNKKSNKI